MSPTPPHTNPWLAAIGGTQSGVLMLQLGEETLVNLPIACHRPWPGLFVSGTPLISPSTPSSVFPPSLPTQFLYPKTVSSFLKDLALFLLGCVLLRSLLDYSSSFDSCPTLLLMDLFHHPISYQSLFSADSSQACSISVNVSYMRKDADEYYTILLCNFSAASHLQHLVRLF